MKNYRIILFFLLATCWQNLQAQTAIKDSSNAKSVLVIDTLGAKPKSKAKKEKNIVVDTAEAKKFNPRKATMRSLILPGLGQAYNKEYWKIPVVYAVLAIPTSTFIYNNTWYKRTKKAYELKFAAAQTTATGQDTANLANIYPDLKNLGLSSLQSYRNSFRKNRDYSALWFLVVWGLNVADATVFAHLKGFNVTDDLSMQVKPNIDIFNNSKGVTLAFNIKKPSFKPVKLP